jgi:hypothetical protein
MHASTITTIKFLALFIERPLHNKIGFAKSGTVNASRIKTRLALHQSDAIIETAPERSIIGK